MDGENPPQDPVTALAAAAASIHELFMAYVIAGFTRGEALHIVTAITTASLGNQSPPAPAQG